LSGKTHDVFISYSHKDGDWVRSWLLPRLEEAGLRVLIDYRDFEIGRPSLVNMERAIERSQRVLLVLSPNWLAHEWTAFEALLVQSDDPLSSRARILPILFADCDLPKRLAILTYADFRDSGKREEELTRLLDQLSEPVPETPQEERPNRLIFETTTEKWFDQNNERLPFIIKQFAIRQFQCIRYCHIPDIPLDTRWIFLLGDNGVGKTSILQALAVGMCGDEDARHLLGENRECHIEIEFQVDQANEIHRFYWWDDRWEPLSRPRGLLAYGPSRLLIQSLSIEKEKEIGPVYSLHRQDGYLRNIERWFQAQQLRAGRDGEVAHERIHRVKTVLTGLMPNVTDIVFDGDSVWYLEKGQKVPAHHLSAGHKSILAMIGDMIICLMEQQPECTQPAELQGIVLIDELEIHLHPKWQLEFPRILSQTFPKVQFIAATHSPIPLIGAPSETVILKVDRNEAQGTRVARLDIDITELLPNTLLTSPLFDMDRIINPRNRDLAKLHTETNYWEIKEREERHEALRRLAEENIMPDFGKLAEIEEP